MIQAEASTQCEIKIAGIRCPNEAISIVFDNVLCCELHRLCIYTAWAERLADKVILH